MSPISRRDARARSPTRLGLGVIKVPVEVDHD